MDRKFHVSTRKPVQRVRSSRRRSGCIRLFVCPTTGSKMEIFVSPRESVIGLKTALARKLRILPSKFTLIYKDKVLEDGCIQDHQIPNESYVTLTLNMESGLNFHHADRSILRALENLTETQVSDFLSGRSPLMLAIHMGENMVFVQLQLSMLQGQGQRPPQPRQDVNQVSSETAAMLSPSALAKATRCLSQGLHRLQEINIGSRLRSTSTSSAEACHPTMTAHAPDPPLDAASTPAVSTSNQATFHLPLQSPMSGMPGKMTTPSGPGAVIDSMKHLGRGIYTGTFQGTLDPSLQDGTGHPRRSVSTILHILNDLLVAAPRSSAPSQGQGQGAINTQAQCPCHTPSQSSTPPSDARYQNNPASVLSPQVQENMLLRSKMQRIQMMLAQRKEQRRTRREAITPYPTQRSSPLKLPVVNVPSTLPVPSPPSSAASLCMAATATTTASTTESSKGTHSESSSEPSSSYCKPNIEQDSLAV